MNKSDDDKEEDCDEVIYILGMDKKDCFEISSKFDILVFLLW